MNIPIVFCMKCGNPRNSGEKICRFCGEPFPEAKNPLEDFSGQEDGSLASVNDADVMINQQDIILDNNENNFDSAEIPQSDNTTMADNEEVEGGCDMRDNGNQDVMTQETIGENVADGKDTVTALNDHVNIRISKKVLIAVCASVAGVLLICGIYLVCRQLWNNSPSDVVEEAYECIKKSDYDSFTEYLDLSNKNKSFVKEFAPKVAGAFGVDEDFDNIDVLNERIEDDTAVVKVRLNKKSGGTDELDVHLIKIDDKWKIKPLGDFDPGSLFNWGNMFGIGGDDTSDEDAFDFFNKLF